MKFNFKIISLVLLLTAFAWEGCNNNNPTSSSFTPPPAVDSEALVSYVGSPVSIVLNPNLYVEPGATLAPTGAEYEPVTVKSFPQPVTVLNPSSLPMSLVQGSGVTQCNSAPCVLMPTSWSGTVVPTNMPANPYAFLVTGMFNDPESPAYQPGTGNFDSIGFQYFPNNNGSGPGGSGTYDLTPFQGIEFYINVSSIDNVIDRLFQAYCFQNIGGASCNAGGSERPDLVHCYDAYEYDYTDVARDQWVFVQKRWADLQQFGNGSPPNPKTFSGANLQQFQYFEWVEANAAASGPMTVNFQVTGMRFY